MANSKLNKKSKYHVIGVMSGTSLDGIDLCLSSFEFGSSWQFQITAAETYEYSEKWKERLRTAINLNSKELENLNAEYTQFLANVIQSFMEAHKIRTIDAVCSHGHTVFHEPSLGKTLQIGNSPVLATYLNQTVVCDFRTQDVALGGQGAPLVPIGDALLFPEYDYCLNLGGFANISFEQNNKRIAFDICPVNIVLNHYVVPLGKAYDSEGQIAGKGTVCKPLLEALNALEPMKLSTALVNSACDAAARLVIRGSALECAFAMFNKFSSNQWLTPPRRISNVMITPGWQNWLYAVNGSSVFSSCCAY